MTDLTPADLTPEESRGPLLKAMMSHIPFDGWSEKSLNMAAADLDLEPAFAELAFPRGPIEVLELHLTQADEKLASALEGMGLQDMKIRDRITTAVRTRFEQASTQEEIVKKGLTLLSLPQNAPLGMKALWATVDTMWRAAGDTSTDHNWYTKRMTLSAVYSAVLTFWINDDSQDHEDTWAFLDRRIEDVMQIEKAKFNLKKSCANMPSLSRFLGRLRYPVT